MFGCKARPAPLPEIRLPKWRRWYGFRSQFGQVNPGYGGIQVVIKMPMVMKPNPIEYSPGAQIRRTFVYVADRAVVMNVLQR
jgi:hypothetical protein